MNLFIQQNRNSSQEEGMLATRQCGVHTASIQLQGVGLLQQSKDSWAGRVGIKQDIYIEHKLGIPAPGVTRWLPMSSL